MTRKLRGAAGASIIMALSIMMVVAALSASMLALSVTSRQTSIKQQQEQQAYLAVTSAARLLLKDGTKANQVETALNNSTSSPKEVRLKVISTSSNFPDLNNLQVKITWKNSSARTVKIEAVNTSVNYPLEITLPS